ncbi:MAG: acyl-CoA dehydrogenase family protein [Lautropia sp.]
MSTDVESIAGAFEALVRREDAAARREEAREGWSPALWRTAAQSGFAAIAVADGQGGSGASLADLGAVVERAAYRATAVPLARANVGALGVARLSGRIDPTRTVIAVDLSRRLPASATSAEAPCLDRALRRLSWAEQSDELLALLPGEAGTGWVARIPKSALQLEPSCNIAGEPCADAVLRHPQRMQAAPGGTVRQLCDLLAVTRASAIAGAVRRVLELSFEYANDRQQFGRAIYGFQTVQHELAELATSVEQLCALLREAYQRVDGGEDGHLWALAAATCAGSAASRAIRSGHQLHGAIGITMEYELQRYTRRLMAWRDEDGSETRAARELGTRLRSAAVDRVWQVSTAFVHGMNS